MSYSSDDTYAAPDLFAADAAQSERMAFIRRTYLHLLGAIVALIGMEAAILSNEKISLGLKQLIGGNWLIAMIAFMVVSWVAERWAHSGASVATQYAGLAIYTVAWSLILCPLLIIASNVGGPNIIQTAALLTGMIFVGLTVIVFTTKADFSFLRNVLWLGGIAALGVIVLSMIMGFHLGILFVAAMIVLLSGWILYDTSNVLHHYRTDQHVGAALALFSSVATMFWYVLQLLMIVGGGDD